MAQFELPAPEDDGLFIPDVGVWSRDKHHFLRRYLHAFTEAMKSKKWHSLHYIDLFAGAGVERLVDKGKVIGLDWGSPLIAAQVPSSFQGLHFVEGDSKRFDALAERAKRLRLLGRTQLIRGDANSSAAEVLIEVPERSLSTAFLDPYGLNLHYATLRQLSARRVDLIIYFPDRVDALRNWGRYEQMEDSELDRVLGSTEWRAKKQNTPRDRWVEMLSSMYVEQIRKLGYTQFEHERIRSAEGSPLYKLIFCSKHEAGGKIWRNISKRNPRGQDRLFP
jgi:three-Cys-motif partner protein